MRRSLFRVLPAVLILGIPGGGSAQESHRIPLGNNVSAETSLRPGEVISNFFLLPLAFAFAMPHGGYTRYPYQNHEGYADGDREVAAEFRAGRQNLARGQAQHAHLRVRGGNRLGWDLGLASYDPHVFRPEGRTNFWSGHITANYYQSRRALFEAGYGIASYQDPRPQTGFSLELALALFPRRPWTVSLRYQGAWLHSQDYHDLSADAGWTWRWFGLSLGFRSFLTPRLDRSGPEATAVFWF